MKLFENNKVVYPAYYDEKYEDWFSYDEGDIFVLEQVA